MSLPIPNAGTRPLDNGGAFTPPWWRFLSSLASEAAGPTRANPAPVSVGPSPYIYRAAVSGALMVQGGGVSALEFTRDGLTWYALGNFYGMFPMAAGDQIRVTYPAAAPVLTFVAS